MFYERFVSLFVYLYQWRSHRVGITGERAFPQPPSCRVIGCVEIRGENLGGESGDPVGLNVELDNTLCINCNLYYSVQTNFYKQQKSTLHVTEGFIVVYGPVAYPKKDNHARFANFRQDFSKKKLDNAQFSNVRASKFKTACMQISNFVLRQHCAHCVGFRHTSPSLVTNH